MSNTFLTCAVVLLAIALGLMLVELVRIRVRVKWHGVKIGNDDDDERDTTLTERLEKSEQENRRLNTRLSSEAGLVTALAMDVTTLFRFKEETPPYVSSRIASRQSGDDPLLVERLCGEFAEAFKAVETFPQYNIVMTYAFAAIHDRTVHAYADKLLTVVQASAIRGGNILGVDMDFLRNRTDNLDPTRDVVECVGSLINNNRNNMEAVVSALLTVRFRGHFHEAT